MESSSRIIKIKMVKVDSPAYKKYMKLVKQSMKLGLRVDLNYEYYLIDLDRVHDRQPNAYLVVSGEIECPT